MAAFTNRIQTTIANNNAHNVLINDVNDVTNDVQDRSDENLLNITRNITNHINTSHQASETIDNDYLEALIDTSNPDGPLFDVQEINIIDNNGILVYSSNPIWVNPPFYPFDMRAHGEQPKQFVDAIIDNGLDEFVQEYRKTGGQDEVPMKYAAKKLNFDNFAFVQVGYDSEHFYEDLEDIISKTVKNAHVGETGFVIVSDANGNVVGSTDVSDWAKEITDLQYEGNINNLENGKLYKGTVKVDGQIKHVRFLFKEKEGYYITAFMFEDEINFNRDMSIYIATYEQFIIFGLIYFIVYGIFNHFVFHDLENVNNGLKKISEGNLNVELNSHYSKEFGELNNSINETVRTLKAINEKEMENAKAIQMGALPAKEAYFDTHHFDIYAEMKTAKQVGGDFYDYFPIGTNKFAILIADVSGKGIPAALFMMRTKSLIKSLLETGMSVDEAVNHTNKQLCQNNDAKMFVTCWIGIIDYETGVVEYVNAGHNPPLIKQNGHFNYLNSKANLVMGGLAKAPYQKHILQLNSGDVIFLYTDGITEAKTFDSTMYGEDRLLENINNIDTLDPQKLINGVLDDTLKFVNGFEQSDDMTLLAFSYYSYAKRYKYEYKGVISSFSKAKEDLINDLTNENIDKDMINQIIICYDEIFSNCAKYAYGEKEGNIKVLLDISPMQIALTISDNGEPFNPLEKEDADVSLKLNERKVGGLGIYMVKNFMDQYHYYYQDKQNVLIMQKYRPSKKGEK